MDWKRYAAVLFDLDGVITPTAEVHRRAWAKMFDEFLAGYDPDQPGFSDHDYHQFVDGKPRLDGVRSFLESRQIHLPEGTEDQPNSVSGLGMRKNAAFNAVLQADGVAGYPGSIRLLDYLASTETKMAIVSSSKNAQAVLQAAGLIQRFPVIVDGMVSAERGLAGKPDPATFAAAADALGVPHRDAVVLEDAVSGVAAGAAGDFGLVIGVDRGSGVAALQAAGADLVVSDLGDLLPDSER